jgi:antitoxin YefM
MRVVSYTQARKSLEAVISQVIENQELALIRRREGGNVVLLPEQKERWMRRLVYECDELAVTSVACRFHYDD